VIYVMALIIGGIAVLTSLLMKDPPAGWKPAGWSPAPANKRPSEHQFTLGEALGTWQMWLLIVSFVLISSAGLAGVSKIVRYSHSFGFTAAAATAAAGGLAIANGLGRLFMGGISERIGRENAMIASYILCGAFLLLTVGAGTEHNQTLFVLATVLAIFFWGPLFSLFPTVIGHYFGDVAAGSNYGLLYAIAKGSGGLYGGVLSAMLISSHGFPFAITTAAVMAVLAGLLIIPLKANPPVKHVPAGAAAGAPAG